MVLRLRRIRKIKADVRMSGQPWAYRPLSAKTVLDSPWLLSDFWNYAHRWGHFDLSKYCQNRVQTGNFYKINRLNWTCWLLEVLRLMFSCIGQCLMVTKYLFSMRRKTIIFKTAIGNLVCKETVTWVNSVFLVNVNHWRFKQIKFWSFFNFIHAEYCYIDGFVFYGKILLLAEFDI